MTVNERFTRVTKSHPLSPFLFSEYPHLFWEKWYSFFHSIKSKNMRMRNIGLREFAKLEGFSTMSIVKNPHTGKLFVSASNGHSYRCEQNIDLDKEVNWLLEGEDLTNACLVNRRENKENEVKSFSF